MKKYTLLLLVILWGCDGHLASEPPLHQAAYRGDVDKIASLLKDGHYADALNSEGATPLHWAAFKGHLDATKYLLRYGADVNAVTKKGSTPLRLAKTHKRHEVAALLKSRGGIVPGE